MYVCVYNIDESLKRTRLAEHGENVSRELQIGIYLAVFDYFTALID